MTTNRDRPLLWLLPLLIGLAVFSAGPVLVSFLLSFTNWDLSGLPQWIGLTNYRELFASPLYWKVVRTTLLYVVLYVPFGVSLAMLLAAAIHRLPASSARIYRVLFFLPVVTSMVAASLVWGWLLNPDGGLVASLLHSFGIVSPRWFQDPDYALPALVLVALWKNAGYNMMILLAGLTTIPGEIYEAATIDGASSWSRFARITLPAIAPLLFLVTILTTISAFQIFEQTYVLTKGGPSDSTLTLSYYVWQQGFQFFHAGAASATAYTLFVLIAILTAMQFLVRKRWLQS